MQFEARQAHFIKDCKTLSGTRVFMCNQMQQLTWLQLLLGLLHTSTWLEFSSAANSGGAFRLMMFTGGGKSCASSLVLPPGEGRDGTGEWVSKVLPSKQTVVGWEKWMNFQLLWSLTLGNAFLFFLHFSAVSESFMRGTPSLTTQLCGLLCSGSALLSYPCVGKGDEHCQTGRDPFAGPLPSRGWVADSSAHLDEEANRGGNTVTSENSHGW